MIAIGLFLCVVGCGSVTGGIAPGDGGREKGQDVTLVEHGEGGTGGAGTDAGQAEGGFDALDVDGGDGRDGNPAGVCEWPITDAGPSCNTVRVCDGAPGCAICCVTVKANGQCVSSPPEGCGAGGGVRCVGDCASCGGRNPGPAAVACP